MANESAKESTSLEALSALADGELDDLESARACASWHRDPAARASWHAYHLIGDVLRSADLASNAGRDAAFLERLRSQLRAQPISRAQPSAARSEPIVVPSAGAATGVRGTPPPGGNTRRAAARSAARIAAGAMLSRRRAWIGSAAVAASFALVAGGVVLTRSPMAPVGATLARVAPPETAAPRDVAQGVAADTTPPTLVADGQLIRDARLDRYLAAHKQFAGSSALGLPSAFLHNAAAAGLAR